METLTAQESSVHSEAFGHAIFHISFMKVVSVDGLKKAIPLENTPYRQYIATTIIPNHFICQDTLMFEWYQTKGDEQIKQGELRDITPSEQCSISSCLIQ